MDYTHQKETLPNGLRLLWLDLPHVHGACLTAFVPGGITYETATNNGVSHLLEHLHLSVTRRHPSRLDLLRAIDALAGYVNAKTDDDAISTSFDVAPDAVAAAAELLADILEVRPYPIEIIESERHLVLNELAGRRAGFRNWMRRALFRDHPSALPPLGTRRSLKRLKIGDLEAFDRASFAPESVVVVAVGPGIEAHLGSVRAVLGALPTGEAEPHAAVPTPKFRLPQFHRSKSRRGQRTVAIGFAVSGKLPRRHRLALGLLQMGMRAVSSPLFEQVRYGSGSTYHFGVHTDLLQDASVFYVTGYTNPADRDRFVCCVTDEMARMRSGDSIPEWLETVRAQYRYFVERALDSPTSIASRIGREEVLAGEHPALSITEELSALNELTAEELTQIANDLFRRENMFVVYDGLNRPFDERRLRRLVESRFA